MKITIDRKTLLHGIASGVSMLPSKSILPILENVFVETGEDCIKITATNMDSWVCMRVPADVQEPGKFTVWGKKLVQIVRAFPAESSVNIKHDGFRVQVSCGHSRFKLMSIHVDEYPVPPKPDFDTAWRFPGGVLKEMVARTLFAVNKSDARAVLQNVLWEWQEDRMFMVCTNSFKLGRMAAPVSGAPVADLVIPPSAFSVLSKVFDDGDEVEAAADNNMVYLRSGSAEVYTRLMDGTFPNYRFVLPKQGDKYATFDREELRDALKRVSLVSSAHTSRVTITFTGGKAVVNVNDQHWGEGHDTATAIAENGIEGFTVDCNAVYFVEVLENVIPSEQVRVDVNTNLTPILLSPAGDETRNHVGIVMPLRKM